MLPIKAQSEELCEIAAALERLQTAQSRLAFNDNTSKSYRVDKKLVIQHAIRLDRSNTVAAIQRHGGNGSAALVNDFLLTTEKIASAFSSGSNQAATAILQDARYRASLTQLEGILQRVCPGTGDKSASRVGGTGASGATIRTAKSMSLSSSALYFGMFVGGTLAIWLIVRSIRKFQKVRRRRSKRYPISLQTHIVLNGKKQPCKVLDLSCNGAKLSISGPITIQVGQKSEIRLFGELYRAQFAWNNEHYCGVNFARPLLHDDVRAASVASSKGLSWTKPESKTAPV